MVEVTGEELLDVFTMVIDTNITDLRTLLNEVRRLQRDNKRLTDRNTYLERENHNLRTSTGIIEINVNDRKLFGYGYKWDCGFDIND